MFDLLRYSEEKFAEKPCLGYRELVKIHSEEKEVIKMEGGEEKKEKKIWQFFEMSSYRWITYRQFGKQARDFGYALTSEEVLLLFFFHWS